MFVTGEGQKLGRQLRRYAAWRKKGAAAVYAGAPTPARAAAPLPTGSPIPV